MKTTLDLPEFRFRTPLDRGLQRWVTSLILVTWLLGEGAVVAQFNSGSNGSDGALNVTTNTTLDVPADGIFHFTTINVATGAVLKFNRNELNTPVYLLATSNVVISGIIDVSGSANIGFYGGKGGPGGFDGGNGMVGVQGQGYGQGPGGGSGLGGGSASYTTVVLSPLIGGSGGAGSGTSGGGGGGGAVLIASSVQITVNGTVQSFGGVASVSGGGGAIRLVAPIVSGNGALYDSVNASGRVRIDSYDRYSWGSLRFASAAKVTGGSQMFVFPPGNQRLDIISAAGTTIPVGTNAAVVVSLPSSSPTNQLVRVQATGFTNDVPIRVKVTPANGAATGYDSVILQSSGNPPYADVNVTLPYDTPCHIHAWTR